MAIVKGYFAPIVLAGAVVASCMTGVPETEFALHPSGARLFCYGCDDAVWQSLYKGVTSGLAQLEKSPIDINLRDEGEPSTRHRRVVSQMEYILASDQQVVPVGATASGFQLNGVDGVRKTFDFDWRGPRDVHVAVQCWTYRFEMSETAQWFVTAELIGPLDGLDPTAREDLFVNTTLACVSGAMNESVPDGHFRSISAEDFAKLAKTLGAAL
jgi:hypothetical protein